MRIVLVEHNSERVLDISVAAVAEPDGVSQHADEWPIVEERALTAARRHDESEGRFYWNYRPMPYCPVNCSKGFDVFVCPDEPTPYRMTSYVSLEPFLRNASTWATFIANPQQPWFGR
jgi:hypothetical protein